jgi:flagellar biosynthetic protein FliQ
MTPEIFIDVIRDGVVTMLLVAGPMMAISLVIGLVVSIVQALTQIQEMTLTFVPKILAMFAAMIVFMPFMLTTLTEFWERIIDKVIVLQ